jgi:chromosome segregation ATPase
VETLKTEVATLKTENTTLKADIEGLKKGFDRLVKRLAKKDQLAEQIAAKTDRIEITEGEIAKAEREKAEVERLLKDPRNSPDAKRHFEGQRRAVTNKLEELRAEKATLVKEREKLEADLTALGKAAK